MQITSLLYTNFFFSSIHTLDGTFSLVEYNFGNLSSLLMLPTLRVHVIGLFLFFCLSHLTFPASFLMSLFPMSQFSVLASLLMHCFSWVQMCIRDSCCADLFRFIDKFYTVCRNARAEIIIEKKKLVKTPLKECQDQVQPHEPPCIPVGIVFPAVQAFWWLDLISE